MLKRGEWAIALCGLSLTIGHAGRVRTWRTRRDARAWLLREKLRDWRFRTCSWSLIRL